MAERLQRESARPAGAGEALEFERALAPRRASRAAIPSETKDLLEFCPCCHRDLVYPLDWASVGNRRWRVALRCPECEWHDQGVYDQAVVDHFDEALDDSTQAILDDLEKLTRANLEDGIERFVAALDADLILPEDF